MDSIFHDANDYAIPCQLHACDDLQTSLNAMLPDRVFGPYIVSSQLPMPDVNLIPLATWNCHLALGGIMMLTGLARVVHAMPLGYAALLITEPTMSLYFR